MRSRRIETRSHLSRPEPPRRWLMILPIGHTHTHTYTTPYVIPRQFGTSLHWSARSIWTTNRPTGSRQHTKSLLLLLSELFACGLLRWRQYPEGKASDNRLIDTPSQCVPECWWRETAQCEVSAVLPPAGEGKSYLSMTRWHVEGAEV